MKTTAALLLTLLVVLSASSRVIEMGLHNYNQTLRDSKWFMNAIYSPTCKVCSGMIPEYQKLSKEFPEVIFGKINGEIFYNQTLRYKITSYPSIQLFHAGIDLPIIYRGEWKLKPIADWLKERLSFQLITPTPEDVSPIVFTGKRDSQEYSVAKALSLRDPFKEYRFLENSDKTQVTFLNKVISPIDSSLEERIRNLTARLMEFSEEAFYQTEILKRNGILFLNKDYNDRVLQQLQKIAVQNPDLIIFHVEPHHPEYKDVLKHYEIWDESSLIALRTSEGLMHRLAPPLKPESITQFLEDFRAHKLPPHIKTQQTKDPHVLTATNSQQIYEMPKDILLVMYDSTKKETESLMKFMHTLIRFMKPNKNLHIFKCNVKKNDIRIGIPVEPVPKLVFFRHRMKEDPVYYGKSSISWDNVIEFIMENTTFDWPEELEDPNNKLDEL